MMALAIPVSSSMLKNTNALGGAGALAGNHTAGNAHLHAIRQARQFRRAAHAHFLQFGAMVSHGMRARQSCPCRDNRPPSRSSRAHRSKRRARRFRLSPIPACPIAFGPIPFQQKLFPYHHYIHTAARLPAPFVPPATKRCGDETRAGFPGDSKRPTSASTTNSPF